MSMFQQAKRSSRKLRGALYGLSGGGKTYSALAIATGMGGKIALIDTERHSSALYSDKFSFDVANVDEPTVDRMVATISDAAKAGYDFLIIDSLSHAWEELLMEVEKLAAAKYRGNTWSAWNEGTPKQKKFINAILDYPGHVLVTMRAETEWATEKDQNGKNKPVKLGLKPNQRKGLEYEFDLVMNINQEHVGVVEKSRYEPFQDMIVEKPGVEFGKKIKAFLNDLGPEEVKPVAKAEDIPIVLTEEQIIAKIAEIGVIKELNAFWEEINPHGEYKNDSAMINRFKARKKECTV